MAGIEELKGKIISKNGMAFSNQFSVELPDFVGQKLPDIVGTKLKGIDKRTANILCKTVSMPGKQIATIDRQIGIYNEKVVNGFAVDDVTMTFYALNDYGIRKYFDSWRSVMIGDSKTMESGGMQDGEIAYKSDYVASVKIHQLSKPQVRVGFDLGPLNVDFDLLGNSIYSVDLIDAFPTTISSIELGNDLDSLVEVSVTFSFTNWITIKDERAGIVPKIGLNLGGLI